MSAEPEEYDSDYFLRGKETGKSLYENYRWMPELTIPMAQRIIEHCGIQVGTDEKKPHRVLDFGCARGYLVKALRQLHVAAYGYDISKWAIENSDLEVYHHLTTIEELAFGDDSHYDWIIAKDVLEHIPYVINTIQKIMNKTQIGVFVVVPLSKFPIGRYVIEEYEKDVTHCQRKPLIDWVDMFLKPGWTVEASYRVPGVKDNYYKKGWERGNGFITASRVKDD